MAKMVKYHGKGMNAARQISRRLGRTIGAQTRSSSSDCIVRTVSLTKTGLAKKMRVSRPYITNLLSGKDVNITFKTAYRFAKALQMDFFPELSVEGTRMPRRSLKLRPAV